VRTQNISFGMYIEINSVNGAIVSLFSSTLSAPFPKGMMLNLWLLPVKAMPYRSYLRKKRMRLQNYVLTMNLKFLFR
jgi:hypothetical protein